MNKVWFITGAGRGMGLDIARAALAAGHAVVATGRNANAVVKAVGVSDNLLVVKLDITSSADAEAAAQAAVERFGRIDVLVNNAANFYAGFFEELSPEDFRAQVETNFFGPTNVTRAVLPIMRSQRSGLVVTISSTAGIVGGSFFSSNSKFKYRVSKPLQNRTRICRINADINADMKLYFIKSAQIRVYPRPILLVWQGKWSEFGIADSFRPTLHQSLLSRDGWSP